MPFGSTEFVGLQHSEFGPTIPTLQSIDSFDAVPPVPRASPMPVGWGPPEGPGQGVPLYGALVRVSDSLFSVPFLVKVVVNYKHRVRIRIHIFTLGPSCAGIQA